MRDRSLRSWRRLGAPVVAVAIAAALPACGGKEPPACDDPAPVTSVTMGEMYYGPECIAAGADATLELVNEGSAPHTFTVKDTEIDADVAAGEQGSVTLTGIDGGTYTVICTYHPQMVSTLVVGSKASDLARG